MLDILNDIRKVLLSNLVHSVENRHITITTISLLDLLSFIATNFHEQFNDPETPDEIVQQYLKQIILKNSTMNKLCTIDDPLLLNACCRYLVSVKELLVYREPDDLYVQLQNQYILDLTNYLWRNRIYKSKKIFNIPSKFIKEVVKNLYLPDINSKTSAIFSIFGIPSTSYLSQQALDQLERNNSVTMNYCELITEEGFKRFTSELSDKSLWISNISDFNQLKPELLKIISTMQCYNHICLLYTSRCV